MNPAIAVVEEAIGRPVDEASPLSGGSICQAWRVVAGNDTWCLKTRPEAPPDFFSAERDGLVALGETGHVRVPRVIHVSASLLLLEWLPPRRADRSDEQKLGRRLAALHGEPREGFGFPRDNYCGLTPQRNTAMADGHQFFARCRLLDQGERAHGAGLLSQSDLDRLRRLAANLRQWIPDQPPSLIHGDLWSGNIHFCNDGPALIDPACHQGWGEADLAMTRLFGALSPGFYDAYREVRPLEPGFTERAPLYNLYHLLNHLNLFGPSWLPQVRCVLDRFA